MIDFPASPTDGQLFTTAGNGVVYKYSAAYSSWLAQNPAAPFGGTGDFSAKNSTTMAVSSSQLTVKPDVIFTGNSGLWYSVSTGRYVPPAGRYAISAFMTASATALASLSLFLYKNGVQQLVSYSAIPSNSYSAVCTVAGEFDANGSDYFEIQNASNIGATIPIGGFVFTAFPLTGMQGPNGPLPAGALSLYSEQVLAATTSAFQIQYPTTARLVEIWFDLVLTVNTNASFNLKATQGGAPNTGSNYNYSTGVSNSVNTFSASQSNNVAWGIVGSGVHAYGVMRLTRPGVFKGTGSWQGYDAAGTFYNYQGAIYCPALTSCDGVQATSSGTFAIGSFLRCLVVP